MNNILTWHPPSSSGAFQRQLPDGRIFSDRITVKPTFSFQFVELEYVEQAAVYTVDKKPMTASQQAEVYNAIQAVQPPLEWFRALKMAEIMEAYHGAVAAISGNSLDVFEIASWGTQEAQARAVLANATAGAPMLDAMRAPRGKGETKEQLAAKIVAAADAYAAAYAPILGRKQAKLDALAAATTQAEIDAVKWA